MQVLTPNSIAAVRFGLFRVRSPLLTESHFVFSSCGYLDVSVPHVSLLYTMDSCTGDRASFSAGFPHSEICASSAICAFTQLIAACHVLRRLLVPGHSPYALSSLTSSDSPVLFFSKLSLSFEIFPSKIELLISFNQLSLRQYTLFMMYYPSAMLSMAVLFCLLILSQDYISLFSFQGTHRLELRSSLWKFLSELLLFAKFIASEVSFKTSPVFREYDSRWWR